MNIKAQLNAAKWIAIDRSLDIVAWGRLFKAGLALTMCWNLNRNKSVFYTLTIQWISARNHNSARTKDSEGTDI
jgi:hypothetical protein